jgi:hypothetical protein
MASNANNKLQKRENLFGLTANDGGGLFGMDAPMYNPSHAPTRGERWLMDQFQERTLAMDVAPTLGVMGLHQMGKVHSAASDIFTETSVHVMAAKDAAQGSDALPYVEEFSRQLVTRCGRHMMGVVDLVDTQIGMVVSQPVIAPPYKPTLIDKLTGRG